jgi:hypothetical protein
LSGPRTTRTVAGWSPRSRAGRTVAAAAARPGGDLAWAAETPAAGTWPSASRRPG